MIIPEGDLEILQVLSRKRRLMLERNDEHEDARPLLLILGGMMCGIVGAGIVRTLASKKLHNAFTDVVGISVGAPIASYMLANMSEEGASIFYEECADSFISYSRFRVIDIEYLVDVFNGKESNGTKKLNVREVLESYPNFYIGVTNMATGLGELIDARRAIPGILDLMKASMEYPILSPYPVEVNGEHYIDGSIGYPFPVQEVIERFNPTHVLVVANGSRTGPGMLMVEKAIRYTTCRNLPSDVVQAYDTRSERFKEGMEYLSKSKIPSLVLWTDDFAKPIIKSTTTDTKKLLQAFELAQQSMTELCEAHIVAD